MLISRGLVPVPSRAEPLATTASSSDGVPPWCSRARCWVFTRCARVSVRLQKLVGGVRTEAVHHGRWTEQGLARGLELDGRTDAERLVGEIRRVERLPEGVSSWWKVLRVVGSAASSRGRRGSGLGRPTGSGSEVDERSARGERNQYRTGPTALSGSGEASRSGSSAVKRGIHQPPPWRVVSEWCPGARL